MRRQTDATIKLDSLYIPPVQDVGMASMYVPGTHFKTISTLTGGHLPLPFYWLKDDAFSYLQYFNFKFVQFKQIPKQDII